MPIDVGTQTLIQVIQNLSSTRSLDEITKLVRVAAREIAQADGATFVLRENDLCAYVDEDAISPLWKGRKFPLSACVSGWAMLHKAQALIPDIYQDSRVPVDAYRPTFVKGMAMTPIRKEDPIGAIGTYWSQVHKPTAEQADLLQALADSVSVAMENVKLYSDLKSKVDDLKKTNQAKDEFLMNVSHELRTPLNSILGWVDILVQDHVDEDETSLGLETIQRNARHQLKIVEDLLDSSRILAGRVHLERASVDLCQIIMQSVLALKSEIQKKNLDLSIASGLKTAIIDADPVRIRQIVDNLLMNAVKFSHDAGKIQIDIQRQGPSVKMSVQDFGEGIESEFITHIFERLQQGDSSTTRKYGGLGLGLSIAKHLVHAFDGEISAVSEGHGKGATFTVTFPLRDFQAKKTNEISHISTADAQALQGLRVLVIDDDNDSRKIVERVLAKHGATVDGVDSVSAALKINQPNKYEVIVCDLSMPEEDGFSLVNKIRHGRTRFATKTPLMALTAFTDSANRERALAEGFDKFMGKPFTVGNLVKSVAQLKNQEIN